MVLVICTLLLYQIGVQYNTVQLLINWEPSCLVFQKVHMSYQREFWHSFSRYFIYIVLCGGHVSHVLA